MFHRITFHRNHALLIAALVMALTGALVAQQSSQPAKPATGQAAPGQPPQYMAVYIEHVKPAMMEQYLAGSKQLLSALTEAQASGDSFVFYASSSDRMSYTYVTPLKSMASLDQIDADWEGMSKKMGEQRWQGLMKGIDDTVEYTSNFIVRYDPELSYHPQGEVNAGEKMTHCAIDTYYLRPGSRRALRDFAKAYNAMLASKKVPYGYYVYHHVTGLELPAVTVRSCAASATDLATMEEKQEQMTAADAPPVLKNFWPLMRRVDRSRTVMRPELSRMPERTATAK